MIRKNTFLALLIVAFGGMSLSAYAQNPDPSTPSSTAANTTSKLYVYRPAATSPGLMKPLKLDYPDVLINGNSIGPLKYNAHLVTELAPGKHKINVTGLTNTARGWETRDIEREFSVLEGQPTFLKLRVEYDTSQMNIGQPGAKYIIHLFPVAEDDAKYEIRDTKYIKPKR